jgi:hypothetical protein
MFGRGKGQRIQALRLRFRLTHLVKPLEIISDTLRGTTLVVGLHVVGDGQLIQGA